MQYKYIIILENNMKNKIKLTIAVTASVFAASSSAMNWVGYNTDFTDHDYADESSSYQTVYGAPFTTLEKDGWVNHNPDTGGYWAANGFANIEDPVGSGNWVPSAMGGVIANHNDAGLGQGGTSDAYMNFFADYNNDANEVGPVRTELIRTKNAMESDNGTYRFSFDARQGANPVDGEFGVKVRIWGGEYWWDKSTTYTPIAVDGDWDTYFVDFVIDVGNDIPSACNWTSEGCDNIQIGFYNLQQQIDGVDQNTGVYIDNLSVQAIPVPAAAWLMGSALLGLAGMKRARK
jgi:hypothetical protein